MNYREYQRLKADAEAEYHRKIEAIEMVWKLSGGDAITPTIKDENTNGNGLIRGSLQQAVRQAYKLEPGEFTHRDLFNRIAVLDPAFASKIKDKLASVSGCLKRMVNEKELLLVEAGKGKRPSKYRRPG
jgi:hypothetical protein